MNDQGNPLRPSFAEREAYREVLAQAYAEGRVDDEEFAARQDLVEQAQTLGELRYVAEGLPTGGLEVAGPNIPAVQPDRARGSWSRRGLLTLGAAAVGFAAAGGIGKLIDLAPDPDTLDLSVSTLRPLEPGGVDEPVRWLNEHGYRSFTDLTLHDDMVSAVALVPGRTDALDYITMTGREPPSARPHGQPSTGAYTFELADIDLSLIPEYVRVAPGVMGSDGYVNMVVIDGWDGGVAVRPYVEGDAYGAGGGYLVWSADGKRLIAIYR